MAETKEGLSDHGSYNEMILQSQKEYLSWERGIVSRPVEMKLGPFIDPVIKECFTGYIDNSRPAVKTYWSVLYDRINSEETTFARDAIIPEDITEGSIEQYRFGLNVINEIATEIATQHLVGAMVERFPVLTPILKVSELAHKKLQYERMYPDVSKVLRQIREKAIGDKKDPIYEALFDHNFENLNHYLKGSNYDFHNLTEMALFYGLKYHRGLDVSDPSGGSKGFVKENISRLILSFAVGGKMQDEHPGVTNVYLGSGVVILAGAVQRFDIFPTNIFIAAAFAAAAELAILPYAILHEAVHDYSANKEYVGVIRARLYKNSDFPESRDI